MSNDTPMREEEYQLLNDFLSRRFGISFPDYKKDILQARLRPRLHHLHLHSYMDYFMLLQFPSNGASELKECIRVLTNNETYFFRETHQFDTLFSAGLELLNRGPTQMRRLRLLSAGCSSGEEPYTISILASERVPRPLLQIDAFDLSAEKITAAQTGRYGTSSMRATTPEQVDRYFRRDAEDRYELRGEHRRAVKFSEGNILELSSYDVEPYDILFCRNVLIYFSEVALHRAIDNFAARLRPGGLLFLGHSESIIGVSSKFEAFRLADSIVYRRTAVA